MNPLRTALLVVGALLLQLHLFSDFHLAGARPEILIAVVLAAGHLAGPERGATMGFVAGLAFDVFLSTPFGLTALVYTVAGYAMGRSASGVARSSVWIGVVAIGVGSAATMLVYGVVGEVLGLDTLRGTPIVTIAAVVALVNLVVAPLALRLVEWARIDDRPRRRSVFA